MNVLSLNQTVISRRDVSGWRRGLFLYLINISAISLLFFCLLTKLYAEDKILVVTEDWAPYNYKEDGLVKGASTDIVRKVLDASELEYSIKLYPWARAYSMALKNENVLIYTIVRTPIRENRFKWIGPIAKSDNTNLYKLSERRDIVINSLDGARKYKVGVIRGSMYHQFLTEHGFNNIEAVSGPGKNYQKLLARRIDLWAESELNFQQELKSDPVGAPEDLIENAFPLFKYPYYMAFSKRTSNDIVNKVREAFERLAEKGVLTVYE
jgi:polar amino acid transport system substrate-binding protein